MKNPQKAQAIKVKEAPWHNSKLLLAANVVRTFKGININGQR